MPVYLLGAPYHHAVIGLTHITEDALVMHIISIAILIYVVQSISGKGLERTVNSYWT